MSPDNPYSAPEASVEIPVAPPGPARLWRIPLWGTVIFVFVVLIQAVGRSLLMNGSPDPSVEIPLVLKILALNLAASGAAFILYIVFLHGTERRPFLQILGVFLFLQLMTIPLAMFMGSPLKGLMSVWTLAWNLAVCLAAYAAWSLYPRKSRKIASD
ncbi:hypothetical protein [Pseudoxanthomonas sacheonensis]|uniref:Uncharacterized protein n=1 Tax=Pseudoxanthomonas sacheonensis TaxID=443615 RepID=A0ABU1RSC4_9GAMM|nr:hypothetical protein [Pseudoxanthomonas sacheonensis]MDR6841009.1 hypothetical protein [Pseudoxanthomonas sacheonensis]